MKVSEDKRTKNHISKLGKGKVAWIGKGKVAWKNIKGRRLPAVC